MFQEVYTKIGMDDSFDVDVWVIVIAGLDVCNIQLDASHVHAPQAMSAVLVTTPAVKARCLRFHSQVTSPRHLSYRPTARYLARL